MKNIKVTIAYDGTEFSGWQIQPGRRTIQGSLVEVAERLVGSRVVVQGAGRTDAGVHALGQVANFRAQSRMSPAEFQRAFNALLPSAVRVMDAEEVEPRFHARWDALAKTYEYRIFRGPVLGPFNRFFALHYPLPLDEDAMAEAARRFEGVHDFTGFAAAAGGYEADRHDPNPIREIFRAEFLQRPAASSRPSGPPSGPVTGTAADRPGAGRCDEDLVFVVRGKSFLRHMVRKMVGTLLDIGRGRLPVEEIDRLFEARDRSRCGPTAPPQGLFLVSVEYPEPWRIGMA